MIRIKEKDLTTTYNKWQSEDKKFAENSTGSEPMTLVGLTHASTAVLPYLIYSNKHCPQISAAFETKKLMSTAPE